MTFRSRLLLFGYPLLEVATAYAVAVWIGWGWMLLLLLLGFPVGFAIMRNAGDAALADAQQAATTGQQPDAGRHALTFVGGVLIMIPGFWSDLVGLLLAIPVTQRLFRERARSWLTARVPTLRMPGVRYPGGDVVQGTVVHREDPRDDEGGPSGPPTPPRSIDS
ncbi:MAG: hypothetical protein GC156_06990 [Actinomycetales bacterium]|nr:hypothetical protein [Actinomycetales bacterium]